MKTNRLTKRVVVLLSAAMVLCGAPALATDFTFAGGSLGANTGTWDQEDDWTPLGGPPDSNDTATIGANKTCTITNSSGQDVTCKKVTVGGILIIESNRTLSITTEDSGVSGSSAALLVQGILDIDVTLNVENGGLLILVTKSVTPGFTGTVEGTGAIDTAAGNPTLPGGPFGAGNVQVDVENNGQVTAYGGSAPPPQYYQGDLDLHGDLSGSGDWKASYGGTLAIHAAVSGPTGDWYTIDNGVDEVESTIIFHEDVCASGDFNIGSAGGLVIMGDLCTYGHLHQGNGNPSDSPTIKVYQGKVARFHYVNCCDG